MHSATQEKFILEERQRQEAKERKMKMIDWTPDLFERDNITGEWVYKYIELVILCTNNVCFHRFVILLNRWMGLISSF